MSALMLVNVPTHGIPYKHKSYWDWVLNIETRLAKRLFDIERAQELKDAQIFGAGARAVVRSSLGSVGSDSATLWVDGKIREVFYGDCCWTAALKEAKKINDGKSSA